FKILLFNYLFSNGDAHFKNFSIIETPLGDFKLSPAYDLLNSRIHVEDSDFALEDGLLPRSLAKGKVAQQFFLLAEHAEIPAASAQKIFHDMLAHSDAVLALVHHSFLDLHSQRAYIQGYQTRFNKLTDS
ncbi:MAG TPA: HipA domain-containing protein, partial [Saprospiraceae bacterium]|nr:HipA domain-containing protein [Saprospiraceae bacterium]